MELLVKSVKDVIQIEKSQLKPKKHNLKMKILGIGNAIIDVICRVEDSFIIENSLTKSTMKLVNENEFKKELGVVLNKYDYPNLNKVTLFDLFVEVYETRYGART